MPNLKLHERWVAELITVGLVSKPIVKLRAVRQNPGTLNLELELSEGVDGFEIFVHVLKC